MNRDDGLETSHTRFLCFSGHLHQSNSCFSYKASKAVCVVQSFTFMKEPERAPKRSIKFHGLWCKQLYVLLYWLCPENKEASSSSSLSAVETKHKNGKRNL